MVRRLRSSIWGLTEVWDDSSARQSAAEKKRFALTQSINFFGLEATPYINISLAARSVRPWESIDYFLSSGNSMEMHRFLYGRSLGITHRRNSQSMLAFMGPAPIIFSGRELGLCQQSITARSNFEHASICPPLIRSPSWELERKRVKGDQIFVRATAYERHFRCRAQAHLTNVFSLERDHARALNELAGLGTFALFLFFAFVFPCLCTKLKQYGTYHYT